MKHSGLYSYCPHDLTLPAWGPYSKTHLGISHVADPRAGIRFDLVPSPGLFRGKLCIPSALWDSDAAPVAAAADLSHYTLHHEISGGDRLFTDITYDQHEDGSAVHISARFVNNGPHRTICALTSFASLRFPNEHTRDATPMRPAVPEVPNSATIVRAVDYAELELADRMASTGIVSDARRRCAVRGSGFVDGTGLGSPFGATGDRASWAATIGDRIPEAVCLIRYRASQQIIIRAGTGSTFVESTLDPSTQFSTHSISLGDLEPGRHKLSLEVLDGGRLELDTLVLSPAADAPRVRFEPTMPIARPRIEVITPDGDLEPARRWWARAHEEKRSARGVVIDFEEVDGVYVLQWRSEFARVRTILNSEIDSFARKLVHDHVRDEIDGDRLGHFVTAAIGPVVVDAESAATAALRVIHCDRGDLADRVSEARQALSSSSGGRPDHFSSDGIGNAERHRPGRDLLAATLLTNIAYPIYTKWGYIRHNTPGRWWDSLYTWDSGFIGIGLSELDFGRARDCLLAYLTELDDPDAPYVQHGTPLPVQIYLFRELWNRYHDRELERYAYPRLKRMYDFLVGRAEGSPTQPFRSGLVTTWKLFYNSGGWDDYPPQVHVHRNGLADSIAPVVSTAHAIRAARVLSGHAVRLGIESDLEEYRSDIARLENALHEYAWDEEAGCFGYVTHDSEGTPAGLLRHESGVNYNLGLDGVSPVVSGSCDPHQRERLVGMIMSPERMWTDIGVSTVDRSAPYYRDDGYWNGAVWMPHQWFLWKAFIDYGYIEEALRIATTALDLWNREAADSGRCYEHFPIAGGRGAGWHQFGGLSAPIVSWYHSLYTEGRVTPGYDVRIDSYEYDTSTDLVRFRSVNESHDTRWVLVSLADAHRRTVQSSAATELRVSVASEHMLAVAIPGDASIDVTIGM